MTIIALQEYTNKVDQLLEENRLVEVVAHCRHILMQHPLHVETYRLLAKAYLEQENNEQALDLFHRILSADPNDFIAHAGLAIIHKQANYLEQAAWHFERAYEIKPYNNAIQEELQQMYLSVHQLRLERMPLTSGVLARFYLRGELYQQAIQELRTGLERDEERVDLRVLLAEALWWAGQKIEAEEVSRLLLEQLPNCIQANAILAEILLQTGREAEAKPYFKRLEALVQPDLAHQDIETAVGHAFTAEGAPQLPQLRELQFLTTDAADVPSIEPTADWVSEVRFDDPALAEYDDAGVVIEPESGMHSYDWLIELNDVEDAKPIPAQNDSDWFTGSAVASEATERPESEPPAAEEEPGDWLQELTGDDTAGPEASEIAADIEVNTESADEDWLDQLEDETAAEAPEINSNFLESEWFSPEEAAEEERDIASELAWFVDQDGGEEAEPEKGAVEPRKSGGTDNLPDWLFESTQDEVLEPIQLDYDTAAEWLQEEDEADSDDPAEAEQITDDTDSNLETGLTDWLNAEETVTEIDEDVDISAALARILAEDATTEPSSVTMDSSVEDENRLLDDSDWLSGIWEDTDRVENEEAINLSSAQELPDWLQEESKLENADEAAAEPSLPEAAEDSAPTAEDEDDDAAVVSEPDSQVNLFAMEEEVLASADAWLQELDAEAVDEPAAADAAETAVAGAAEADQDDDEEDWLGSFLLDEETPPLIDTGTLVETEDEEYETAVADDIEQFAPDELPDWLTMTEEPTLPEKSEKEPMGENDEKDKNLPPIPESENGESPDVGESPDQPSAAEGMPDWLQDISAELEDSTAFEEPADPDADIPPAGGEEIVKETLLAADELPDWLQEGGKEEDGSDWDDPAANWLDAVQDDDSDDIPEVPDWLQEPVLDARDEETDPAPQESAATGVDEPELEMGFTDFIAAVDKFGDDQESLRAFEDDVEDAEAAADIADADSDGDEIDLEALLFAETGSLFLDDELENAAELEAKSALTGDEEKAAQLELGDTSQLTNLDPESGQPDDTDEDEMDLDWLAELSPANDELPSDASILLEDEAAVDLDWLSKIKADMSTEQEGEEFVAEEPTPLLGEVDTPDEEVTRPKALEEDIGEDSLPDDWGDAMSWLEDLASQQADPVEELPTVAENLLADKGEVDELSAAEPVVDSADEPVSIEANSDLDDLLESAAALPEADDETAAQLEQDARLLDDLMAAADSDISMDPLFSVEDEDEAATWLSSLTGEEDTPLATTEGLDTSQLDELLSDPTGPAAQPEDSVEEADLEADGDDAQLADSLSWLDELALDEEPSLEEMSAGEEVDLEPEPESELEPEPLPEPDPEAFAGIVELSDEDLELLEALDFLEQEALAGLSVSESGGSSSVELSDDELQDELAWIEANEGISGLPSAEVVSARETEADIPVAEADESAVVVKADDDESEAPAVPDEITADADDEDEEALDWLEQMVSGDTMFDVEMEPPPIRPSEDALFDVTADEETELPSMEDVVELEPGTAESLQPEETELETDEVAEKRASFADEDLDMFDMPDDPDAALAWLEQMSAEGSELAIEMEPPPIKPSEDAVYVTDDAAKEEAEEVETAVPAPPAAERTEAESELTETEPEEKEAQPLSETAEGETAVDPDLFADLDDEFPDDPDDALAWLEQMAAEGSALEIEMEPPPIKPSEDAVYVTDAAADSIDEAAEEAVEQPVAEAEPEQAEIPPVVEEPSSQARLEMFLENVPDDPDEAMSWLEQMAAEQSDDLPPATAGEESETALPPWLGEEDEQESDLLELLDAAEAGTDTAADEDEAAAEEAALAWLDTEHGEIAEPNVETTETGWLESLPEMDVDSWLSSEEEATSAAEAVEEKRVTDTGPLRPLTSSTSSRLTSPLQEPSQPAPEIDESRFHTPGSGVVVDEARLGAVRDAVDAAEFNTAADLIQDMISAGSGLTVVIAELEGFVATHPQENGLQRLLGDAYMRNGQLQKALDTYRMALDNL